MGVLGSCRAISFPRGHVARHERLWQCLANTSRRITWCDDGREAQHPALPESVDETTRKRALEPTGRIRKAVEMMVWQGTKRDDAAGAAGILPKSLYNAFRRHYVKQFYLAQLEVLRTSARARNFHRLEALADQDDNRMAAVAAVKAMEQISDAQPTVHGAGRATSPGVVIVINQPPPRPSLDLNEVITVNPVGAVADIRDEQ